MKRVFRVLVLSAGAFILLQGPHPPKVRADMECVKSIATDYEDYCVYCCKNSWPTQIATYITDGSLGSWCYTTGSVNCGGVSDPSNCTASQCGTFQYSSDIKARTAAAEVTLRAQRTATAARR
jgi:hypothetical protein